MQDDSFCHNNEQDIQLLGIVVHTFDPSTHTHMHTHTQLRQRETERQTERDRERQRERERDDNCFGMHTTTQKPSS